MSTLPASLSHNSFNCEHADMDLDGPDTNREVVSTPPVDVNFDPEQFEALIEAGGTDEDGEFVPSDYDDESMADSTSSISSNIYQHSYQNGRRYHKFRHGRYPIPNDEYEQNREDMLHAMMLEATDGRRFFAPIPNHPLKILDLGTGTGIWAIEMADKYPSAEVLGVVPYNRPLLEKESNLTGADPGLQVEDTWENGRDWDFVHLRNMIPILNNLKPGAWVELQDVDGMVHCDDGTMPPDWPVLVFTNLMVEAFARLGTKSHAAVFGGQYLAECGFVNIQHHTIKLPYGTWPRDNGRYTTTVVGLSSRRDRGLLYAMPYRDERSECACLRHDAFLVGSKAPERFDVGIALHARICTY
ncbi:hypothetical protein CHU98_g2873 [Xylaria longipes]|nr:hypothetical protein CHU98_g2873 [Xylaria longipes]